MRAEELGYDEPDPIPQSVTFFIYKHRMTAIIYYDGWKEWAANLDPTVPRTQCNPYTVHVNDGQVAYWMFYHFSIAKLNTFNHDPLSYGLITFTLKESL